MIKWVLFLIPLLMLEGCTVLGIRNFEILSYKTLLKEKNFEVRVYDDYLVAAVEGNNNYKDSSRSSFGLLFKYISGNNVPGEKIAMTSPVLQKKKKEKMKMTAPVFQNRAGDKWEMSFVLPSKYNLKNVPVPSDPRVVIKQIKNRKVVAVRYSGTLKSENIKEYTSKLLKWADNKGYRIKGIPYSAGYDPPWTIPCLRRNEVLVEIK